MGIVGLFWSLDLQAPRADAEGQDRGVVAFVSPHSEGAMLGWLSVDEALAPRNDGSVTLRFSVAASQSEGTTVVIGGSIASNDVHCFADGGTISEVLGWSDLDEVQQRALLQTELTRPVTGRVDDLEQNRTRDQAGAQASVEESAYIVVRPGLLKNHEVTVSVNGVDRTYPTHLGSFECSFPARLFWEDSGSERILAMPDVVGARGSVGTEFGEQTYLYVHRTFGVDVSDEDLIYSSVDPRFDDVEVARFVEYWSNYDYTAPSMVSLAQTTAVMSPTTSELSRQLTYLAIGFLVATEIALLPVIARAFVARGSDA
jgi:hypothetical protein